MTSFTNEIMVHSWDLPCPPLLLTWCCKTWRGRPCRLSVILFIFILDMWMT